MIGACCSPLRACRHGVRGQVNVFDDEGEHALLILVGVGEIGAGVAAAGGDPALLGLGGGGEDTRLVGGRGGGIVIIG